MGFIDKYPYSDFHELNLDWILEKIKELEVTMSNFVKTNQITFSGTWDITEVYTAWTVVVNNNVGYLSVQPVPSGVLITDADYWVEIFDINAPVQDLESRVADLENTLGIVDGIVNGLKAYNQYLPTKVLCIGDSYGMKISQNWTYWLQQGMGLSNSMIVNKCTGSSGFVGNTGIKTFLQQLQEVSDKTSFTHIVIAGGFNDAYDASGNIANTNDIEAAINNCAAYIKANYPNAKVFLGFCGYATGGVDDAAGYAKAETMMKNCATMKTYYGVFGGMVGWCVMSKLAYVMKWSGYFDGTDYTYNVIFHPSANGNKAIAACILSYIKGGDMDISVSVTPVSAPVTGLTFSPSSGFITEKQNGQNYELTLSQISITGNLTMQDISHDWFKILDVNPRLMYPCNNSPLFAYTYGIVTENSANRRMTVAIKIVNGEMFILVAPDTDTNGTVTRVLLTSVTFKAMYGDC